MFMLAMMGAMPSINHRNGGKNGKNCRSASGHHHTFPVYDGKSMGGIGVSLTTAAIYVGAAIFTLNYLGYESLIPYEILPWFFIFTILFILMVGSGMAALGATCNDNKDAQSLTFPAIIPVILPMFIIVPVIQDPSGPLATTMSFIPPFTPTMMMIRLATPVTVTLVATHCGPDGSDPLYALYSMGGSPYIQNSHFDPGTETHSGQSF